MKNLKVIRNITLFLAFMLSSFQSFGSNLSDTYIKELESISKIEGNGNNKVYKLIRESSNELTNHWSPKLAKELGRVFNELLNANQNHFLVELIGPAVKKEKRFLPILKKELSDKNKVLYKELVKMVEHEDKFGNGE